MEHPWLLVWLGIMVTGYTVWIGTGLVIMTQNIRRMTTLVTTNAYTKGVSCEILGHILDRQLVAVAGLCEPDCPLYHRVDRN